MKPRFSILAVLLLTAYAGALFAALTGGSVFWGLIAAWAPGLLLPCTPLLVRDRRWRQVFSRGAGIAALISVIVMILLNLLLGPPDPSRTRPGEDLGAAAIFMNVVLVCALIGGTIALVVRRSKKMPETQRGTEESLNRE